MAIDDRPTFKAVSALLAALGLVANVGFVYLAIDALHRAHWAYRDLMRSPRAYGREIAPATIASLQEPRALWVGSGAFILASIFGLALALHLLRSLWQLGRSPERGRAGIAQYRRIKPIGAAATALAFFAFASANHSFWVAATRHVAIGSGPPVIETAILAVCGLLPWWWVGKHCVEPEA
jgi:hypothetical protein